MALLRPSMLEGCFGRDMVVTRYRRDPWILQYELVSVIGRPRDTVPTMWFAFAERSPNSGPKYLVVVVWVRIQQLSWR